MRGPSGEQRNRGRWLVRPAAPAQVRKAGSRSVLAVTPDHVMSLDRNRGRPSRAGRMSTGDLAGLAPAPVAAPWSPAWPALATGSRARCPLARAPPAASPESHVHAAPPPRLVWSRRCPWLPWSCPVLSCPAAQRRCSRPWRRLPAVPPGAAGVDAASLPRPASARRPSADAPPHCPSSRSPALDAGPGRLAGRGRSLTRSLVNCGGWDVVVAGEPP